ncbi:MAG: caspase family protein [Pirellulaceae bacterium]|nr:caspase family protein [Pirellulaceae bacterium]
MRRDWRLWVGLLALVGGGLVRAADPTPPVESSHPPTPGWALLVGCTRYPRLSEALQLEGPGNDVVMMRDLLVERFKIPAANVTVLSEAGGEALRPTRQHIEAAFQRLAKVAKKGDQVVILMAGHGSQQPDIPSADDPEPDGLDEIFLPADVGEWHDQVGKVENAIADDELRGWLRAIQDTGASVWLIMDSCHSGTMSRDVGEVSRQVLAEKLVPAEAIKKAVERAAAAGEKSRGREEASSTLQLADNEPSLVAIYAAQSSEPTVEKFLPPGNPERTRRGLLTYTMHKILTESAQPLTYRELVQRVQAQYVAWGRTAPTPLIEGNIKDNEVLGQKRWPGRSRILLTETSGQLGVSAGELDGLSPGAVLAVFPLDGGMTPAGHVRVTRLFNQRAEVEPCEFEGQALVASLPVGGRCEIVFVDYGASRLAVAVDPLDQPGSPIPAETKVRLEQILKQLDGEPASLIRLAASPAEADWLLRLKEGKVYLAPAASAIDAPPPLGPPPAAADLAEWLGASLKGIARAENLKRVAARTTDEFPRGDLGVNLEVSLERRLANRDTEKVVWQKAGIDLFDGDVLLVRFKNAGRVPIDITLLYVDSAYGITSVFPAAGEYNRIEPGKSLTVPIDINATTRGLEHIVVIAVKGEGQNIDFTSLEQPSIEVARTRGPQAISSPLGQLMESALYGQGKTRGGSRSQVNDYAIRLFSWNVRSGQRPAGTPAP